MATLATFELRDHLNHTWKNELVGFPLDKPVPDGMSLCVRDERGQPAPCQLRSDSQGVRAFFQVDELPALGRRTFRLETTTQAPQSGHRPSCRQDGDAVVLSNGLISVRVPANRENVARFVAPVLAVRRGAGPWIGEGRIFLSDVLQPKAIESACGEQGPLWLTWQLRYLCQAGEQFRVDLRLYAGRSFIEITESSELSRQSRWEFSVRKGLDPDHSWTHPHQVHGQEGRLRPVPFHDAVHRSDLGSIQLPIYSGIWIPDDYYYLAFLQKEGDVPDCVAAAGVNGGFWDYPYENQIDACFTEDRDAFFRASIKSGHRRWLLLVADRGEVVGTRPFYRNPIHQAVKSYETPLDKVKDYVLEWEDVPASQRPFLVADRQQLAHAQRVARDYRPLREYVASLNPDLPGDFTYYHSGTHRVFSPDRRNDPAVLYVVAETPEQRLKQARFLKDVVMTGLADRREGMLDHVGHCDSESASINVGRGLRPWVALFDFAAAEGVLSEAERKLAQATFAFYAYKINDPDYWPAEHLVFRDDHPRSAHRTHWFPGRQSDWALYNIDNIPHNFHGDLWSAAGCIALAFPTHPESRAWVNRTLEFWESELTQWIFPEGAWLESSTYTLNSMKDYLIYCRGLANARIRDYFSDERLRRAFRFYAETLLPHDDRIHAASIPVLGDASYPNGFGYVLGWMAGLTADDPEFSGMLQAIWKQTGEYLTEPGRFGLNFCDFLFLNPFLSEAATPPRASKHFRGLGVLLRHAADTDDDIYMFIKAGIIYSHFHEPEGTFILWWNRKPLCDEFGVQYGPGTSEQCNHNCIEVRAGSPCVYNKGEVSRFITTDAFDFVTVDAPILQAYLRQREMIWGYRGEMGPAGWHRRHILLVKPFYVFVYDDLECAHPTTYHLSVKARDARQAGNHVHFQGELGVDMEFLCLNLSGREIRHTVFDVTPSNWAFVPPAGFYRQRQVHIDGAPNQPYATLLVPHAPALSVSAVRDPATGGARVTVGSQCDRVMLFPTPQAVRAYGIEYDGMAGAVRTDGERLGLLQVVGTRIGVPGQLLIEGDGPFCADLAPNGALDLATDGVGRWLNIRGQQLRSCTQDGRPVKIERTSQGTQQVYVPRGRNRFTLTE
jgi:hypothetical protein